MVDGQAPYLLAPHVHLCVCGRHGVLMDLRRDRYVAVQPGHLLAGWVSGWPGTETPGEIPTPVERQGPRAPALLSKLLAQGMLAAGAGSGRPATVLALPSPQHTLHEFDFDRPPPARAAAAGLALIERPRPPGFSLQPLLSIRLTPEPTNYMCYLEHSRSEAAHAAEAGAEAVFIGSGGDQLFYQECAQWAAEERLRRRRAIASGKLFHAHQIVQPFDYYDPLGVPTDPERVAPLLSQPLMELCLRLPIDVLTTGGWDRAIARRAFYEALPPAIRNRRHKGGMEAQLRLTVERNRALLRALLGQGQLVREGLLDPRPLDLALSGRAQSATESAELLEHAGVEAWARRWANGCTAPHRAPWQTPT